MCTVRWFLLCSQICAVVITVHFETFFFKNKPPYLFLKSSSSVCFLLILETGKERERETVRERNIDVRQNIDQLPCMCPDWV